MLHHPLSNQFIPITQLSQTIHSHLQSTPSRVNANLKSRRQSSFPNLPPARDISNESLDSQLFQLRDCSDSSRKNKQAVFKTIPRSGRKALLRGIKRQGQIDIPCVLIPSCPSGINPGLIAESQSSLPANHSFVSVPFSLLAFVFCLAFSFLKGFGEKRLGFGVWGK